MKTKKPKKKNWERTHTHTHKNQIWIRSDIAFKLLNIIAYENKQLKP